MSEAARYTAPSGVHARHFGDELVILDLASGTYFGLDQVGAAIWDGLLAGLSAPEIAEQICASYDVEPTRAANDVTDLVSRLLREGLLRERV
jgi:hypothetical protein